ncbi:MAG: ATP-binding protein [Thermoplasmatales archaeon]
MASFDRLNFHVVVDPYRVNLILDSAPSEGKVVLDIDKRSMSFSRDIASIHGMHGSDDGKTGLYRLLEVFGNVLEDPRVKNVFIVGTDFVDVEDLLPTIYKNLHRLSCNIHFIAFDETALPFEFRVLCRVVSYPPSTPEEREKIFREAGLSDVEKAVKMTEGMTLSEVSSVAEMAKRGVHVEEAVASIKIGKLKDHGLDLIDKGRPKISELVTVSKKFRKKVLEIVDSHEKVSILFVGAPGSGKTFFSEVLLNSLPPPSVKLESSRIIQSSKKERDIGKNVLRVVEMINPHGLLIDQFDVLSGKHGLEHLVVMDKVLNWLESRRFGVLLCTTVRVEEIDPQLIRPGRFDAVVLMPLPGYEERYNILRMYGVKEGLARRLAAEYKYYTPADLMNIAKLYINASAPQYPRPNLQYMVKSRDTYLRLVKYVKSLSNGVVIEEVIT